MAKKDKNTSDIELSSEDLGYLRQQRKQEFSPNTDEIEAETEESVQEETQEETYETTLSSASKAYNSIQNVTLKAFVSISRSVLTAKLIALNPITYILIFAILIYSVVAAGSNTLGKSDFNFECTPDGVSQISMNESTELGTRQRIMASWFQSNRFDFLDNATMTKEQASGIVGNMTVDSSVQPTFFQGQSEDYYEDCDNNCILNLGVVTGKRIGVAAWDGSRRKALAEHAIKNKTEWHALNTQLSFLREELDSQVGKDLLKAKFNDKNLNPEDYAEIWSKHYSKLTTSTSARKSTAEEVYKTAGTGTALVPNCIGSLAGDAIFGDIPGITWNYEGIPMGAPLSKSIYAITATWGIYSPFGEPKMHYAIDLAPRDGQQGHALYSMISGTVSGSGYNAGGWGYWVRVRSDVDPSLQILYGHLTQQAPVTVGQKVAQGQFVGILGNTGASTNPHVHIEFIINGRKVNPQLIFDF